MRAGIDARLTRLEAAARRQAGIDAAIVASAREILEGLEARLGPVAPATAAEFTAARERSRRESSVSEAVSGFEWMSDAELARHCKRIVLDAGRAGDARFDTP